MSNKIKQILNDFRWRNSYKLFFYNIYRFNYTELFGLQKNGKSLEVYFLSVLTIIFYLSYFILIFVGPR